MVDTANAAQQSTQEMESECSALQAENEQLRSLVRSMEVQVSELQADVETRSSALESLEGTLSKIERSVDNGRDRSPAAGEVACLCTGTLGMFLTNNRQISGFMHCVSLFSPYKLDVTNSTTHDAHVINNHV